MIQKVEQRRKLAPNREPYWAEIGTGQHVGYRRQEDAPNDKGPTGTWIARHYDPATRKRSYCSFGDLASVTGADQFTQASKLAQEWFAHLAGGGSKESINVREACERYVAHLGRRGKRNDATASKQAAGFFAVYVYPKPIAGIPLLKLLARHVGEWAVEYHATKLSSRASGAKRPQTKGSLNRGMAMLRAALNLALADNYVTSPAAWKGKLKRLAGADNARTIYLSKKERAALLHHMDAESFPFFRALCSMPVRPGALAAARVCDFDSKTGEFIVGIDKAGAGRKLMLPAKTAELFRAEAKRSIVVAGNVSRSKTPNDPIFARADGSHWDNDGWRYPMRAAVEAAGLDPAVTAYAIRHAVITDLIHNGLDIFTIAKLAGTSVEMIEKYYGKVSSERIMAALATLVA